MTIIRHLAVAMLRLGRLLLEWPMQYAAVKQIERHDDRILRGLGLTQDDVRRALNSLDSTVQLGKSRDAIVKGMKQERKAFVLTTRVGAIRNATGAVSSRTAASHSVNTPKRPLES